MVGCRRLFQPRLNYLITGTHNPLRPSRSGWTVEPQSLKNRKKYNIA